MNKAARFVELSWLILEHKYRYYMLSKPIIQDYEYDMLEKEYDGLADEIGLPKSASDMVGFKEDRPCCQKVMEKLAAPITRRRRTNESKV